MAWKELKRDLRFAAGVVRKRPFQVLVQVTNRCNMKCDFCDFWPNGARPEEEMSLEDYRRLAEDLAELGTFLVSIEGGEPFLRGDLVEIVRAFSARHISALFTNGWFVDAAAAHALFDAGMAQVGVSIDYPDAERHDRKRAWPGAFSKAWRAVEILRDAAPHGGRQVHVMTVLMEDNWRDLDALLKTSAAYGVGHSVTLISTTGFRRAPGGGPPAAPVSEHLVELWKRHRHFKIFREYLQRLDSFLGEENMPQCRAGVQSFNIDHVGNVAPCIEKIDSVVGNVRAEPLAEIHRRMADLEGVKTCQDCWTACRSFSQLLGNGAGPRSLYDLSTRMRSS